MGIGEKLIAGDIISHVKQVQLSEPTAAGRKKLCKDHFSALLSELKSVRYLSITVDEWMVQLTLYLWDFAVSFATEQPHNRWGHACCCDSWIHWICWKSSSFSLMAGHLWQETGFASRLVAEHPTVNQLHCIIHPTVLCAKLSGEMKTAMNTSKLLITFAHTQATAPAFQNAAACVYFLFLCSLSTLSVHFQ